MEKIFILLELFLIIIIILGYVNCDLGGIDLSDKNPVVYCLKRVKRFTFQQVKDYLLKNQDPEYALENSIYDEIFAYCVEQVSKDNT